MMRRCRKCGEEFPATGEFFVTITSKAKGWSGLATECRPCRNLRYRAYYEKNRAKLIARAIISTKKRRLRPEVREQERVSSRRRKQIVLADPVKREEHNERNRRWYDANRRIL